MHLPLEAHAEIRAQRLNCFNVGAQVFQYKEVGEREDIFLEEEALVSFMKEDQHEL